MCTSRENVGCVTRFWTTTFILCLIGLICMFIGGIFSFWEMFKTSDRRFVIPICYFVACVLMTAALFDYGSWARINSHSSRSMLAAIVFGYVALPISAFIAGRYSAYDRYVNNGQIHNGQKYVPASTNGN
jgi:cytochrome c biogenesis factor